MKIVRMDPRLKFVLKPKTIVVQFLPTIKKQSEVNVQTTTKKLKQTT